jgi:hypothetical protein
MKTQSKRMGPVIELPQIPVGKMKTKPEHITLPTALPQCPGVAR